MSYNDRVTILKPIFKETKLGMEPAGYKEQVFPCRKGSMTHNDQMGMFGSYQTDRFKLHVQGHLTDVKEVVYSNQKKKVERLVHHKNATVIYL